MRDSSSEMSLSSPLQPQPQPTMKFLILAAVLALAAADYHDETFHFSTLGSSSGLQRSSLLAKQYTAQAAPLPVYRQQYATLKHLAAPEVSVSAFAAPAYKHYAAAPAYKQYAAAPAVFAAPAAPVAFAAPAFKQFTAAPAAFSSYSASASARPQIRILSQVQETDPAGPYKLSYSTENGIKVEEQGSLVNSAEGPAVAAQGSYSYTGDDNQVYTVSYVADENGFRAAGDHLPTPPPIPAEILKSLEENARSGEQYDDQGRLLRN